MAFSLIDPSRWILPNPERVVATMRSLGTDKSSAGTKGARSPLVISTVISPVDLYAYLKSRFGPPNGFAMTLRSTSVDNLIHWQYTLECSDTVFDITGLNTRTEILAYSVNMSPADLAKLQMNIQAEIACSKAAILQQKKTFEHWRLFLNPYRRLSTIVSRCDSRLRSIAIPEVQSPPIPATRAQLDRFFNDMQSAAELYQEAMELCVTLDIVLPVMGEAAVNFFMLVLAKPEIRNDERMREDFGRRPIDVRIKSLHLVCEGFAHPVTGSEDEFKAFLRIMNRRNDTLHGNVDPRASTGEEILFDFGTIPLLNSHHTFSQIALANALANLSPEATLDSVDAIRKFVEFLLSRLQPDPRALVGRAMEELHLGFRTETGSIGVILPPAQMDFFPVVESDNEDEQRTQ